MVNKLSLVLHRQFFYVVAFNQKKFSTLENFQPIESVLSKRESTLASLQSCTYLLMQALENNGLGYFLSACSNQII